MGLRIYLARHGQTDWNAERRLQGWTDIPLNETGRRQARQLAEKLAGIELDRIYCSVLQRSRQTAEIVSGGNPIEPMSELREQSHGKFEGKALLLHPLLLAEFLRRRTDPEDSLDGGESRNQHRERIRSALQWIASKHPDGGQILIVGHGGTNSHVLQILLNHQDDMTFHFENTDVYLIETDAGVSSGRKLE